MWMRYIVQDLEEGIKQKELRHQFLIVFGHFLLADGLWRAEFFNAAEFQNLSRTDCIDGCILPFQCDFTILHMRRWNLFSTLWSWPVLSCFTQYNGVEGWCARSKPRPQKILPISALALGTLPALATGDRRAIIAIMDHLVPSQSESWLSNNQEELTTQLIYEQSIMIIMVCQWSFVVLVLHHYCGNRK